jgi:hypothetical protein
VIAKIVYLANLLSLATHFRAIMAQTSTGSFLYPEKTVDKSTAILVNVIDTVVVEWTSNFKDTWLWLWCDPSDTNQKFLDKCISKLVAEPHAASNKTLQGFLNQYRKTAPFHTRLPSMAV